MDRKALAPHLTQLTLRMALDVLQSAPQGLREMIMQARGERSMDAYAVERFHCPGVAYGIMTELGPIAIGGVQFTTPGVGVCWMICNDYVHRYPRQVLRLSKELMRAVLIKGLVHRIEAHVRADEPMAQKFVVKLGFTLEGWAAQAAHDRVAHGIYSLIEGRDATAEGAA